MRLLLRPAAGSAVGGRRLSCLSTSGRRRRGDAEEGGDFTGGEELGDADSGEGGFVGVGVDDASGSSAERAGRAGSGRQEVSKEVVVVGNMTGGYGVHDG